jgi:hypothetical protein
MGKTKILQTPWNITKDMEDLECWILELQVEFLNMPSQMGKTKILQTPWNITKDMEDLECWILELQVEFLNMPSPSPQHC